MTVVNREQALQVLKEQGVVVIKAAGNSMTPIMTTGDLLHLQKVSPDKLQKNDVVFCKINGRLTVHLISAIDSKGQRFQISNNHGYCNGWINAKNIFGLCTIVNDRILIDANELSKR